MSKRPRTTWWPGAAGIACLVIAAIGWHSAGRCLAQPADAADAEPAAGSEQSASNADEPPAIDPQVLENPVVRRVLAVDPDTPEQLARAIRVLIQLRQPAAARLMIQKLFAMEPSTEQFADMAERFGIGWFGQLRFRRDLVPEGRQWADRVAEAFRQRSEGAESLDEAIRWLGEANTHRQRAAMIRLRGAGTKGLAALVGALQGEQSAERVRSVQRALIAWGPEAVEPLLAAATMSQAPDVQVRAIEVLAHIGSDRAGSMLLEAALAADDEQVRSAAQAAVRRLEGDVPPAETAAERLMVAARQLYAGGEQPLTGAEQVAEQWRWEPGAAQPTVEIVPRRLAELLEAARLAAMAGRLDSQRSEALELRLAALSEAFVLANGWEAVFSENLLSDPSLTAAAEAAGLAGVANVLDRAIRGFHTATSAVAARLLARWGRVEVLSAPQGRVSALVEALRHSDERVRFAALEAIVRLDPVRPFAGSNRVVEGLRYFVTWQGEPLAAVMGRNLTEGRRLAALLAPLGYRGKVAVASRELFYLAADSTDVELILLDMAAGTSLVAQLVEELRRDARTAGVPIGLVADEATLEQAARLAEGDALCRAMVRPQTSEAMATLSTPLFEAREERLAEPGLRRQFARAAVAWIAHYAARGPQIFDLRALSDVLERALYTPELAADAAEALAHLATAEAQRALVDVASQSARPIEVRNMVAAKWAESVKRFGMLLSSEQILRQYDRYNASRDADRKTQQVLGFILDVIEGKVADGQPLTPTLENS